MSVSRSPAKIAAGWPVSGSRQGHPAVVSCLAVQDIVALLHVCESITADAAPGASVFHNGRWRNRDGPA